MRRGIDPEDRRRWEMVKDGVLRGNMRVEDVDISGRGNLRIDRPEPPKFEFDDQFDIGFVGDGNPVSGEDGMPEEGDVFEIPASDASGDGYPSEGEDEGDESEPGSDPGPHGTRELSNQEVRDLLDDVLDIEFQKGKEPATVEKTDPSVRNVGPNSRRDMDRTIKQFVKRGQALHEDEDYVYEALKVDGWGPDEAFEWARANNFKVNYNDLEAAVTYSNHQRFVPEDERDEYNDIEEMKSENEPTEFKQAFRNNNVSVPMSPQDERFRDTITREEEEEDESALFIIYRDASGSMSGMEDLVDVAVAPLLQYLEPEYDNAVFTYLAHDSEALELEDKEAFLTYGAGGGTRLASALELSEALIDGSIEEYNSEKGDVDSPNSDSRPPILTENHEHVIGEGYGPDHDIFMFGAGDGGISGSDRRKASDYMESLPANLHLHFQVGNSMTGQMQNLRDDVSDLEGVHVPERPVNGSTDLLELYSDSLEAVEW